MGLLCVWKSSVGWGGRRVLESVIPGQRVAPFRRQVPLIIDHILLIKEIGAGEPQAVFPFFPCESCIRNVDTVIVKNRV